MEIRNSSDKQNFNGLYFKNVSPKVRQALENSPVIQKIGNNYDLFISQYAEPKRTSYGKILEYGLRFRYSEIVPNLFHKKIHYSGKGSSDFALNLRDFKTIKEIENVVNEDLAKDAELLNMSTFKLWMRTPY